MLWSLMKKYLTILLRKERDFMSRKTAMYYPQIALTEKMTLYGAVESNMPTLYDKPLTNYNYPILKVDLLIPCGDRWGKNIMTSRDLLYILVSHGCDVTTEEYSKIFQSYYRKYATFANYVTNITMFGDSSIPWIYRVMRPIRESIECYKQEVDTMVRSAAGTKVKFLMHTHDYVYYSYLRGKPLSIEGGTIIC